MGGGERENVSASGRVTEISERKKCDRGGLGNKDKVTGQVCQRECECEGKSRTEGKKYNSRRTSRGGGGGRCEGLIVIGTIHLNVLIYHTMGLQTFIDRN